MRSYIIRYSFSIALLLCLLGNATAAQPKIVIVGAGAAGVAAATTLIDDGFTDVTILEATSRIGGRINTVPFGKNVVDLGATWVQAKPSNIVSELGIKEKLLEYSPDTVDGYTFVRSNAQLVTVPVWKRLQKITAEIEEARSKELGSFEGSLGEYTRKKYEAALAMPENADIDKAIAQEYYETYEKGATGDEGAESLYDISARDYAEYEENESDSWMLWKDKGSIELLNLLMETRKSDKEFGKLNGKIRLSKPVANIKWQQDNKKALITTQDGEQLEADHVIVTVSLGVLKNFAKDMFEPNLPAAKETAIKAMGFGGGNKIFIELKKPFWHPDWNGAYFLWRDEDLNEIRGTNRSWLEGIDGFFTVPYQPNVLFAWNIGNHSREMEALSEDEIKDGCLFVLNKFLPPDQKEIINMRVSTWTTDPCFFGGFSYHSLATEKANVNNHQLEEPVKLSDGKLILLFAGEATVGNHYGTVHGAVESGIREAKRLKEAI